MLTDEDLIRLIDERRPGEWPAAEMEQLRQRWMQSSEVREALRVHLELEAQLTAAVTPASLTVEKILNRSQARRLRRGPRWWLWLGLAVLAALVGSPWFLPGLRPPFPAQIAQQPAAKPDAAPPTVAPEPVVPALPLTEVPAAPAASALQPENPVVAVVPVPVAAPAPLKPAPQPQPVPSPIVEAPPPWAVSLGPDAPLYDAMALAGPRSIDEIGHGGLTEPQARGWLTAVEGERWQLAPEKIGERNVIRSQGLCRLRAPFAAGTVLRITAFDIEDISIHCWKGPVGRTLRYYTRREPHLWAAFRTERETAQPKPPDYAALLGTDSGACYRSTPGTFDLRWQDGRLIVARGDLVLLAVLTPELPDEIFLEGQFRLRGISLHRGEPLNISEPAQPAPLWTDSPVPAWPWTSSLDAQPRWEQPDQQPLRWTAGFPDREAASWRELPEAGFYDIVLQLGDAVPGTGVYLGDAHGKPLVTLALFRNRRNKRLTCGALRTGERREESDFDPDHFATPVVAPGSWLRLVGGAGVAAILVSDDGVHWGHLVENPLRDFQGVIRTVGLLSLPSPQPRTLSLRQFQVRELTAIASLISPDLLAVARTIDWTQAREPAQWRQLAEDQLPAGERLDDWLAAAALATLPTVPGRTLHTEVIEHLLPRGLALETQDWEALLAEAGLILDWWDDGPAQRLVDWYEEVGNAALDRRRPGATHRVQRAFLRAPLWTRARLRDAWDDLTRRELLQESYSVAEGWPARVLACSRRWRFLRQDPHPDFKFPAPADTVDRLTRWASFQAATEQGDPEAAEAIPASWRHPYQPAINKEAYNFAAELATSLQAGQIEDACRTATDLRPEAARGLLPLTGEPGLAVSVPVLLADALASHPQFAAQLRQSSVELGRIRLRQAMETGDADTISLIALQFSGVEIASEALIWLGDRQLAAGQMLAAEDCFARAADLSFEPFRGNAVSRLELMAALRGEEPSPGQIAGDITLGEAKLSAAEFADLISEIRRDRDASGSTDWSVASAPPAPYPAACQPLVRHTFTGSPGLNPGKQEFSPFDTLGRQLAVTVSPAQFYVSNRIQVTAYDPSRPQPLWSTSLGNDQGEAYDFPNQPMSVVTTADAVFVRRLSKAGVELARLNALDGKVVWKKRPALHILTDPLPWRDRLLTLAVDRTDDDSLQISGLRWDPATGTVEQKEPLFRLRDVWEGKPPAAWTLSGRVIVLTVGGITARISPSFDVEWLDRPLWLPAAADVQALDFWESPPIIRDDCVFVAQPAVKALRCLELATGRTWWRQSIPDLTGLVGEADGVVAARAGSQVVACASEDGKWLWRRPGTGVAIAPGRVLTVTFAAGSLPRPAPQLLWWRAEDGFPLKQSTLEALQSDSRCFGPAWRMNDTLWTTWNAKWDEGKRDLIELVPTE